MGVAVLFPGQGTQVPGMGEPWRASPQWSLVERAESVLAQPLAPLLLDAPELALSRTREAQLAVLLASLLAWDALKDNIDHPVAFAGHSLGQVTALVASGALSFEDGVKVAAFRAEATQAAADERPGRMAAFIGASTDQVEQTCIPRPGGEQEAWLANDNAPGQVVVGGTAEGVEAAIERARQLGVRRVVPLNVGAAFHTPLMAPARERLMPFVQEVAFGDPSAPIVSNADARPYPRAEGWASRLGEHLVRPVLWKTSMETLVDQGAATFIEVGPGAVLGGLARRTVPDVAVRNVAVPVDVSSLMEVA